MPSVLGSNSIGTCGCGGTLNLQNVQKAYAVTEGQPIATSSAAAVSSDKLILYAGIAAAAVAAYFVYDAFSGKK